MASPVFFLQSLVCLADLRQISVLSKYAASFRSSSSHLLYGFPEDLACTNCRHVHFFLWFHGWGRALKNPSSSRMYPEQEQRSDTAGEVYDMVLTIQTCVLWQTGYQYFWWRNVRRILGTSVIKDMLINKQTVQANQPLSFIKHSSIRAYGRVNL